MDPQRHRLTVTPEESRRRLDRLLAGRFPSHSRSYLQKLIRGGSVLIGGAAARQPSRAVAVGEVVDVAFPPPRPTALRPEDVPLSILHEDDDLLVIDKPAGMVVHPGAGAAAGTLVHALLHHCRGLSGIGGVERPGIVHRLDKQTSGVLVAAKNDAAHRALTRQFHDRTVEKEYAAVVWGIPRRRAGVVDLPIGRDRVQRVRISTRTASPRAAVTAYRVAEPMRGFCLLEVHPRTGRTHQIRVHLKELGHPIVGDAVYGGARWSQAADAGLRQRLRSFTRLALHARRLSFTHPSTGLRLSFEAPLPADFEALLEALRK